VSPIDFKALAGRWFHAHISPLGLAWDTHALQVLFQDAQTAAETQRPESLRDDHGTGFGILLQQFSDRGFKRVQFAGALPASGGACRRGQVMGDAATADVEMSRDFAHRPVLGEVDGVDLFGGEHVLQLLSIMCLRPNLGMSVCTNLKVQLLFPRRGIGMDQTTGATTDHAAKQRRLTRRMRPEQCLRRLAST
jgi:hypothetical protein